MKTTQECQTCKIVFTRFWAKSKPAPKHCSRACANKQPGRMTSEIRDKIRRTSTGKGNHNYKGGWRDQYGYIHIGSVLRSHIIWDASHPNAPIQLGEVIHHLNGIVNDDRLENLGKISSQSEHASHHQKGRKHSPTHIANQAMAQRRNRIAS